MTPIDRAVNFLRQGRLVAFPTETVYGLGADATNPAAIELIFRTKGRPDTNPLIVHVSGIAAARRWVTDWPETAQKLTEKFWPGPLTIILPKRQGATEAQRQDGPEVTIDNGLAQDFRPIPDNATAGLPTVALRVPDHPLALALLRAFDGPLAAPSANRSTRVSPTTAAHVLAEFPDSDAALRPPRPAPPADAPAERPPGNEPAMVLDGGACSVGIESTVLDLTTTPPTVLRPGRVTPAELEPLVGPVRLRPGTVAAHHPAASPGQHPVHYAPRTPAFRFETSQRGLIYPETAEGRPNGIVALSPLKGYKSYGRIVAMPNDPADYARRIYGVMRELDQMRLDTLYVEMPPDRPEWAAVRDRLARATKPLPAIL